MKRLLFFLTLFILSCNDSKTPKETQSRSIARAAEWPYVILQNGDSLFQIEEEQTITYNTVRNELHPFEGNPDPDPDPIPNQRPVANAGPDQTITGNTVSLDASKSSDVDGTIDFLWTKVSGTGGTIQSSNAALTSVTGLTKGVYRYKIAVTDNTGAIASDEVIITVNDLPPPPTPGTTYTFSLTKNTAFKKRNFSGYENWNGQNYTSFTGGWSDYYFRFAWTDIEHTTQGNYNWTRFDNEIRKAITAKAKFSFGFMIVCDCDDFLREEFFNGTSARYPKYVHDKMQSESVKDFAKNSQWIPNWNSTFFLDRFDAAMKAVANHINTTSYNGVAYKDIINYVDIRGYGQWGEWHAVGFGDPITSMPSGTRPTVASYKRIIDTHIAAFPNWPLVALFAAYDANWLGHTMTPPEVTNYVLTARNAWGLIGYRRDQWGQTDNYVRDYLENNNRSFGSSGPFKNIITERWKYAPVLGEPYGPGANLTDLENQIRKYHAVSIGNGNYTGNTTSQAFFKNAENAAGYKLSIVSGTVNKSSISLSIENWGNTPCYENYDLVYQVVNSSGTVVWTATSTWKPLLKLPGVHSINDNVVVPIATGNSLRAVIKNNYRVMPLFNNGQNADGSIVLKTF